MNVVLFGTIKVARGGAPKAILETEDSNAL
jgi:hypothetical protein